MATVYRNNSSRRFPETDPEVMEKKWDTALGPQNKNTCCSVCRQPAAKLYFPGGTCKNCRGKDPVIRPI